MTIEALIKMVTPPAEPFEAFRGPWEPIEAELGTALPQDYKDFVGLYGAGYFMEFLGIAVPRSRNRNVRLEVLVGAICDTFVEREELPYPFWPDPGGLVPFGGTDEGDFLFLASTGRAGGLVCRRLGSGLPEIRGARVRPHRFPRGPRHRRDSTQGFP